MQVIKIKQTKKFVYLVIFLSLFVYIETFGRVYAINKHAKVVLKEDSYVESGYPTTLTYYQRNLYAGFDSWFAKRYTKIYLVPDYSKLQDLNITPDSIVKAKLFMYLYNYEGSYSNETIKISKTPGNLDIYSITWQNQPQLSYYYYCQVDTNIGFKSCSVTGLLREYLSDYKNMGEERLIELELTDNTHPALIFWSTECLSHPDVCTSDNRPYLDIEYKDASVPTQPILLSPDNNILQNNSNIVFSWQPAQDPDGDSLKYRVIIAKDSEFNEVYKTSIWTTETTANITIGRDGTYYWRVEVKDEYGNNNFSKKRTIHIDTHAPVAPKVYNVPPFTNESILQIKWYLEVPENNVKYLVEYADNKDFINKKTSEWILDSQYSINVTEGVYFVRVRAQDLAGNISDYSRVVKVVVDFSKPQVKNFAVNKNVFNSQKGDKVKITADIEDKSLNVIGVEIYNNSGNLVYQYHVSNKNRIYMYWPSKKDLPEGYYFIYIVANDLTNHAIRTKPIVVYNDLTPPQPLILGDVKEGKLYPKARNLTFKCIDHSFSELNLYINSQKIVRKNNVLQYKFSGNNKSFSLRLKCIDKVGLTSYKSVRFTVDTLAPKAPSVSVVKVGEFKAKLNIKCESGARVQVAVNGVKMAEKTCTRGTMSSEIYVAPGTYAFDVFQKDRAGNMSPVKHVVYKHSLFKSGKNNKDNKTKAVKAEKIGTCHIKFNIDKHKINGYSCKLGLPSNGSLVGFCEQNNNCKYVGKLRLVPRVNIVIDKYACKPFTFWDIRTWFSCVEEFKGKDIGYETVFYTFKTDSNEYGSKFDKEFKFVFSKKKVRELKGELKAYVFVKNIAGKLVDKKDFTWKVSKIYSKNKRPLGWIFDSYVQVSQWHGYTKFQHPHSGIDFSVYKKRIKAPADGKIVALGYHMPTRCFGGGYYVGIKHANNLYTFYFHLQYIKGLKKGQTLKKGQYFAVTGNSGKYHCRSLPYHLHFEVRKCISPRCHVNPVPYMDVNWSKVKTATRGYLLDRLSGENPHPGY